MCDAAESIPTTCTCGEKRFEYDIIHDEENMEPLRGVNCTSLGH